MSYLQLHSQLVLIIAQNSTIEYFRVLVFLDNLKLAPLITRFVEATRVRASTSAKMEKLANEYSVEWVLADHTSIHLPRVFNWILKTIRSKILRSRVGEFLL